MKKNNRNNFIAGNDYEIESTATKQKITAFYLGNKDGFDHFKTNGGNVLLLSNTDLRKDYKVEDLGEE